ncbi:MAG: hypothetical protein KDE27_12685, partial [Planctomycetes bacterium]|nr:hypothetical protein [Planctomycetota bacterium]
GDGPRDRRRRTRRAALGLAEVRLAAVQADLLRRLGPDAASRIELRAARAVVADGLEAGGRVLVRPRARNRVVDRSTAPPQPKPKSLASPDLVPDQRL